MSKRSRDDPDLLWASQLAAMVQASLVGYAVGGLFLNKAYFDLFYHLVAIMVLTRAEVSKALQKEPSWRSGLEDRVSEPALQRGYRTVTRSPDT